MKAELEKLVAKERKFRRELAELRGLLRRLKQQVNPDPKALKLVEEGIAELLK